MPRTLPLGIQDLMNDVPVALLPALTFEGTPEAVVRAVCQGLALSGFGPPGLAEWLCSDIEELASVFASVTGVALIGLQLASIVVDRPPRFDVDTLGHRLVTTYRGIGAEWLPPGVLAVLPPGWPLPAEVSRRYEPDPHSVLRDGEHSTAEAPTPLHGSPSHEGRGGAKLLLSIDDYGHC